MTGIITAEGHIRSVRVSGVDKLMSLSLGQQLVRLDKLSAELRSSGRTDQDIGQIEQEEAPAAEGDMVANSKDTLLTGPREKLDGLNTYIEGKMKRYSLLFAVNGGAFAIAKVLGSPEKAVVGGLSLKALAIGAVIFTLLMWRDIYLFGEMMRSRFFGGELVFGRGGKLILAALSLLVIFGWLLAAF